MGEAKRRRLGGKDHSNPPPPGVPISMIDLHEHDELKAKRKAELKARKARRAASEAAAKAASSG